MSNYRRGADKERELVRQNRDRGAVAARSAGSKSPVDVWAVDGDELHLIPGKSRRETVTIPVHMSCVKVRRFLAYKVKGKWCYEELA